MKLQMALTERDKKLLVLLGLFLIIVVFGYFVMLPMYEHLGEIQTELETAETEKMERETKIMMLPTTKTSLNMLKEQLSESVSVYYKEMPSQEIDRLLTFIVLDHDLQAKQLTISMPEDYCSLSPFAPSELAAQYEETSMLGIKVVAASMSMSGDIDDLYEIIDDFSLEYPAIRLVSYSFGGKSGDSLEVELEVYMYTDEWDLSQQTY